MANETFELAVELLKRRSLTPDDAGCHDLIARVCYRLGFHVEHHCHNGVDNLWARKGTARTLVCFAGHTDVVPTGPLEQWTSDPFDPDHRDGMLYGRGAADMKTSIAAFVVAIEEFLAAHPDHAGSHRLAAHQRRGRPRGRRHGGGLRGAARRAARTLDYCIVGEPTSVERARRHDQERPARHALRQAHGQGRAGPHRLPAAREQPDPPGRAGAGRTGRRPSGTTATTTSRRPPGRSRNIHAGTGADNVIPGAVEIDFNFRFSTASTAEGAASSACTRSWTGTASTTSSTGPCRGQPFLTPRGELVRRASQARSAKSPASSTELSTTGGTSRRPLHRRHLPAGGRVRPAQRHHPQAERARRGGGHRAAVGHLPKTLEKLLT